MVGGFDSFVFSGIPEKNVAPVELKTNSGWLGEKPTNCSVTGNSKRRDSSFFLRSKVKGSHEHSERKKGPKGWLGFL